MARKIETENHVKALVADWFKQHGAWSYAPIQNGLGVHGIHDRIGCVPVVVTQDMVGKKIGLFVSVECKKPGRRQEPRRGMSAHQYENGKAINLAHGVAWCVDGLDDLEDLNRHIFQVGLPNV